MNATAVPRHRNGLERVRAAMAAPRDRVVIVNVPMANYLMVDGHGGGGAPAMREAVCALAELSATLRLYLQDDQADLLAPMPLEILWASRGDDWREALRAGSEWTAMIAQPARTTPELVAAVRERTSTPKRGALLRRIRLGSLREGLCAQVACDRCDEPAAHAFARLENGVRRLGFEPRGPRHEIYLADLGHACNLPLRTIVRLPIRHAA